MMLPMGEVGTTVTLALADGATQAPRRRLPRDRATFVWDPPLVARAERIPDHAPAAFLEAARPHDVWARAMPGVEVVVERAPLRSRRRWRADAPARAKAHAVGRPPLRS
jgi:hypothetical protein